MKCKRCGADIPYGVTYCSYCGEDLRTMFNNDGIGSDDTIKTGSGSKKQGKKKKWIILSIAIIVIGVILSIFVLNYYMQEEPYTADDAQALVKAALDSDVRGTFDENFDGFANMTQEEVYKDYEELIKSYVDDSQEQEKTSDSLRDRTMEMWRKAFSKCQYSITNVEQRNDGSFSVKVSIKPLDLYSGMDDSFYEKLIDDLLIENPDFADENINEQIVNDAIWNKELDQLININLENPVYRDEEFYFVSVDPDVNGYWEADQDDIDKIVLSLINEKSRSDYLFEE